MLDDYKSLILANTYYAFVKKVAASLSIVKRIGEYIG